jgi:phosphopentomutase
MSDAATSQALSPPWEYRGRVYLVWKVTDVNNRDGVGWELEDVGPSPGRGIVLEVFKDDAEGGFMFTAFTDHPLPFELVHRFVAESAREIQAP